MKPIECARCGSGELFEEEGYAVCAYCRSRHALQPGMNPQHETVMDLLSDIQLLLQKCESDPANSRRYANLILDIDPTNQNAMKYLR